MRSPVIRLVNCVRLLLGQFNIELFGVLRNQALGEIELHRICAGDAADGISVEKSNFMTPAPAIGIFGFPSSRRSRTSTAPCQPAAPHQMKAVVLLCQAAGS